MTIATVSALTCPACGGPLTSHSIARCRICGVTLVLPVTTDQSHPAGEPTPSHRKVSRLRAQLKTDPGLAGPQRQLGHAYHALGLTDDAVQALTVASRADDAARRRQLDWAVNLAVALPRR